MWYFRKPSLSEVQSFLTSQRKCKFSYKHLGEIQGPTPSGFDTNQNRVLLGSGTKTYAAACEAIRRWKMFPRPWTEPIPCNTPLHPGHDIAVLARCYGIWWLNACRIVRRIEQDEPTQRFGFIYGTLAGHMESGEELFVVERDAEDRVWYEVASFSRPGCLLTSLGYPLARWQQRRFVRDSGRAMQEAVLKSALPNSDSLR